MPWHIIMVFLALGLICGINNGKKEFKNLNETEESHEDQQVL